MASGSTISLGVAISVSTPEPSAFPIDFPAPFGLDLALWLGKTSAPVLRAVEIAPAAPPLAVTAPVLITPQGVRIEGATVEALATLLRALR